MHCLLVCKKRIKSLNSHATSVSAVEIIFHYSGALTYEFNSFLVTQTTHMFCKITASTNGLEMVNDIQLISRSHGRLLAWLLAWLWADLSVSETAGLEDNSNQSKGLFIWMWMNVSKKYDIFKFLLTLFTCLLLAVLLSYLLLTLSSSLSFLPYPLQVNVTVKENLPSNQWLIYITWLYKNIWIDR